MSKQYVIYECLVPNLDYSHNNLKQYLKKSDDMIVYLSTHGKFIYKNNKIQKLIESTKHSYEKNGIYVNEKTKTITNVQYLPNDINCMLFTTHKYVYKNITMFIEQYQKLEMTNTNISTIPQENIWFEIYDVSNIKTFENDLCSFIANINI